MSANIIPLSEIALLLQRGRALDILDVRTPAEFARVHAAGARLMPLDELEPVGIAAERRDVHEPIYVICQSGARAAKACQRLQEAGVIDAYCVEGGTASWEKMGLPVERGGTNIISLERQVRIGAGIFVLVGVTLAWAVHPAFVAVAGVVGAGLVFAGVTDYCGMAIVLGKMPWNRVGQAGSVSCSNPKAHEAATPPAAR